jgi:glycosyltransferase involved in cell wall biosynthesis
LHVVLFSEHFHKRPSGPHTSVVSLAAAMHALGHEVTVLNMGPHDVTEALPGAREALTRRYAWKPVPVRWGRPRFARALARIHASRAVDVVICMGVHAAAAAQRFRARTGVPFVVNPRSGWVHPPESWRTERARELTQQADAFVGISRHAAHAWLEDIGCGRKDGVFAVHNGFDPDRLLGDVETPDGLALTADDAPLILCLGMLRRVKGQHVLLHALAGIQELPWHLAIAGDGPERDALNALCIELGLVKRVTFTGMAEGPCWRWLYHHAQLFCLYPVYPESFGNTFLEAQAAGLPVISSDAGALPEIIADGETGLVVPLGPGQNERLGNAIARLLNDRPLRRRMADAARSRAAGFTWQDSARGYLEACEYARTRTHET